MSLSSFTKYSIVKDLIALDDFSEHYSVCAMLLSFNPYLCLINHSNIASYAFLMSIPTCFMHHVLSSTSLFSNLGNMNTSNYFLLLALLNPLVIYGLSTFFNLFFFCIQFFSYRAPKIIINTSYVLFI